MDKNKPAEGSYGFQFKIYDGNDPCTDNLLGGPIDINDVEATDGHFVVELDFGSSVFDGNAAWLETRVTQSPMGSDPATLRPLLELTPTPYALYAKTAQDAHTVDGKHASDFIQNGAAAGGDLTGTYPNPTIGEIEASDLEQHAASDTQFCIMAAERRHNADGYTEAVGLRILRGGTLRVKFDLKVQNDGDKVAKGRVYKNGVAFGTEQTGNEVWATFTEDLVFSAGDRISIYIQKGSGVTRVQMRNFTLCSTLAYLPANGVDLIWTGASIETFNNLPDISQTTTDLVEGVLGIDKKNNRLYIEAESTMRLITSW